MSEGIMHLAIGAVAVLVGDLPVAVAQHLSNQTPPANPSQQCGFQGNVLASRKPMSPEPRVAS